MFRPRVIPILLLKNSGLYKTVKFKDPKYVGDPINALKIFNDKYVDELVFLDITATNEKKEPNMDMLRDIASECFMPLCYGGGINSVDMIREVLKVGVEKVAINSAAITNTTLVKKAAEVFGSSTIVVSMDVKKNMWGKNKVYINSGKVKTKYDPVTYAKLMASQGAGEILVNSIDRDGTMKGFDLDLVKEITAAVDIPVIAAGGAGSLQDFKDCVKVAGASAVAAGSFFVFQGKHRAVLITYPPYDQVTEIFA